MHRVFIALSLSELAADALSQLQFGVDGARWRPPEAFHLTLQFVGDVDRHGLEDIASAMSGVAAPSFSLTLKSCGYFGDRKPRALWVGAEANDALTHLQAKVETALRRFGLKVDNRKFVPHVTLAYIRGIPQPVAETFCASHSLFSFGPFPISEFHLYESYLGGEGSHYEIIGSWPLLR